MVTYIPNIRPWGTHNYDINIPGKYIIVVPWLRWEYGNCSIQGCHVLPRADVCMEEHNCIPSNTPVGNTYDIIYPEGYLCSVEHISRGNTL